MISGRRMKIVISIDGALLLDADETARQLGLTRSRLSTLAVGDFLKVRRKQQMLLRLNEVYADGPNRAEKDPIKGIRARVGSALTDPCHVKTGGEGGIRTPGRVFDPTTV